MLLLSGCTQLEVRRHTGGVIEGVPYTLPATTLVVTVDYEIERCETNKDGQVFFDVAKKVAITAETTRGERFVVPYESLRNVFKDTEFSVESHPGSTLKSVSTTISDKTGPALTGAVGTVLRIAGLQGGMLAMARDALAPPKVCTDHVIEALQMLAKAKAKAEAKAKANAQAAAKEELGKAAKTAQVPGVAAQPAVSRKADNMAKPAQADAGGTQTAAAEKKGEDPALEAARQKLRARVIRRWTPTKKDLDTDGVSIAIYPPQVESGKWLTEEGLKLLDALTENEGTKVYHQLPTLRTVVQVRTDVPLVSDPTDNGSFPGFVVRQPAYGVVRACQNTCMGNSEDDTSLLTPVRVIVPQLGDYVIVPLKNRVFAEQTLNVSLGADGSLDKIGFKDSALVDKAAGTLNTNLDAYTAHREARQKLIDDAAERAADRQLNQAKDVAELNKAIKACLDAQKDVKDVDGIVVGTCQ
ncbi:hypothetical protein ACFOHT_15540 [Massilia oculi]|nr:hypothetical protein [Massilia oculi]